MTALGGRLLLALTLTSSLVFAEPKKASVLERYGTSCLPFVTQLARLPRNFWTPEKVIAGIQALYPHRDKVCLLNKVLVDDRSERTAELLSAVFGQPVTGSQLVIAARSFFPTWPEAVEAAGKKYEELEVLYGVRVWTRARILSAIRLLRGLQIDIGTTAMGHDRRPTVETILTNAFGFRHPDGKIDPIGGQALYGAAQKEFGDWPKALKAAGYNPNRWNRRGAWSEASVLAAIRQLHRDGVPLNIWSVMRDTSPETLATIRQYAKFSTSGNGLTQAAVRRFGSWDHALLAAGLTPADIRKYRASTLPDGPQGQLEFWTRPSSSKNDAGRGGGKLYGKIEADPADIAETNELREIVLKLSEGQNPQDRQFTLNVVEIILSSDNLSNPRSIASQLKKDFGENRSVEEVRSVLARLREVFPTER